ncbi:MAG TPA: N-acetylglucosamine-6-phosphate deacetylase [Herpetosiphon sp.]|uniref:N-acetylglucosamine-6-phosphate deacetylase n=1 Tax=Herpetosiphon aurantiacus (strain ATCC 23779 / DSM 785 / 114-95) TaxID=316274 RepID=A9B0V3_HERA2|nr:N-acetylglucosamine-6-phosphate deacetylase [Herpetosiphon sp.]ABX03823.1 N-acetylglucosamine-6-phosphate deacetylase [Herpetosiphon aurantiacus DSM 785]HBW48997.1 N-acetylglucosamine-6-phosphate deacetylase [Herpetosiphon sp.]
MSSLRFENATIYTPELSAARSLAIANGHVAEAAPTAPCYDLTDLIVVPGLIDLQLNGAFGHDFTSDPHTIGAVAAGLPQYGVTAFLPTIITSPLSQVAAAQQVVQQGNFTGSRVLGLHLEGPFLNPAKRGAHNPSHLQNPSLAAIETWSPANGVRLVTLAPELDAADELIRALVERGVVVSAGHSEATFEEAEAGFNQGIRAVTHLFNAMPALHHREPGLAGAALSDQRITMGLIPDGVHVHAGLVRHIWHSASQRIAIVSDAQAALGMPDGEYLLGDTTLTVANGEARRSDGRLAGSVLAMDQALRNIHAWTNSPLEQILPAFTTIPANLLGLAHYGRIAINNPADLVIFDQQHYQVVATLVGGNIVYGSTTLEQRQC